MGICDYAPALYPFRGRVTLLTMDVTNPAQIQRAVENVESLDILINNAGVFVQDDLNDRAGLDRNLAVNLFGTHGVSLAFLPFLARTQGAIVNVLSLAALASVPFSPAYSISKAAAFSLTQSLRALWAGRGVKVHAVLAGPVDTDMARDLDLPKTSPELVARGIFDRVGERRRGDFSRSDVSVHCRRLAQWYGQGAGAAVCSLLAGYGECCVNVVATNLRKQNGRRQNDKDAS